MELLTVSACCGGPQAGNTLISIMKPSDHPEFFRLPPPEGTSRESSIRLDAEGRFWHEGTPLEHGALEKAFRSWINRHPDDGRLILTNGYDWCYFEVDDVPYFVDSVQVSGDGQLILTLFDGTREPVSPTALAVSADGRVYANIHGGKFEAKFTRFAMTQLGDWLVEVEPHAVLRLGERDWILAERRLV